MEGGLRWWARAWSKVLGLTVGYGYRPWLAASWVGGLWVAGVALFTWGPAHMQIMLGLKGGQEPKFSPPIYVSGLTAPDREPRPMAPGCSGPGLTRRRWAGVRAREPGSAGRLRAHAHAASFPSAIQAVGTGRARLLVRNAEITLFWRNLSVLGPICRPAAR